MQNSYNIYGYLYSWIYIIVKAKESNVNVVGGKNKEIKFNLNLSQQAIVLSSAMLKFMAHPTRKLKISNFPFQVWFMTRKLMCIIIITSKSIKSLHIFVDLHQCSETLYNPSFLCTLFQIDLVIVGGTSIRLSNNPIATWEESLLGIFFWGKKEAKSLIIHCGAVSDRTTDSSQASHCMCGIHVMNT